MKKVAILGLAATVCIAGCGASSASGGATSETMPEPSAMEATTSETCPLQVNGTTVTAADITDGATLTFVSSGDVAEVRRRVRQMAEMHNRHHAHGGGMMGGTAAMPAMRAFVDEVDGGARLVLRPVDSSQTALIQAHARTCADRMSHGECPRTSSEAAAAPKRD